MHIFNLNWGDFIPFNYFFLKAEVLNIEGASHSKFLAIFGKDLSVLAVKGLLERQI